VDFGSHLRQARERRGISLRQIAIATKISVRVLEALERNDISKLPGGIFSRAFVKSYAVEVGLDSEETVREFVKQFASESMESNAPVTTNPIAETSDDEQAFQNQQRMAGALLRLVIFSVPLAIALIYFTVFRKAPAEERQTPPSTAAATAPGQNEGAATPASDAPAAAASMPAAVPNALTIELRPQARCWVELWVDGKRAVSREMQAGEREMARARDRITLRVGDASALAFVINDKPGRRLGEAGEVVNVTITKDNFRTFLQ
jgi:cytoskeleton protein RodZ